MRRTVSALRAGAAAAAALIALASCATVPKRAPSEWLGVLPEDATMYVSFAVPGSADLVKKALKDAGPDFQDVGALMDRTDRMVAAVTLAKGAPVRFDVAALGNYPAGIIGMRLSGNKEWKESSSSSGKYWQWSKAGLQMGIPNNGILLASNGGIEQLLSRWTAPIALSIPPDAAQDMLKSDFVLYMPELPGNITEGAAQKGLNIPIQEVWLNAVKQKNGYELSGAVNTTDEREAKLLGLALKLGLVAWMRSQSLPDVAQRLAPVTIKPVGLQVRLAGLRVTNDEIIPLFLSFVKGLNAPPAPAEAPAEAPAQESPVDSGSQ